MKRHIVYRIINLINSKYYIGVHSTNNIEDGYMGSGSLLKKAVKKYGAVEGLNKIYNCKDTHNDALQIIEKMKEKNIYDCFSIQESTFK